jgi:ComF family protein
MVYQWLKNNLYFPLSPQQCLLCEQALSTEPPNLKPDSTRLKALCSDCFQRLPHISNPCFRCALGIPEISFAEVNPEPICGACIADNPLQYRTVSPLCYLFPIPELIAQMKFQGNLVYLKLLTEVFADYAQAAYQNDSLPQCIVPVPLHANREFVRGFNQAELLASQVAKALGLPCETLMKRTRNTPSQMHLKISERERNMKNAFALRKKSTALAYQHVAIFDDVLTTGATTQSMARVLLNAGCRRVDIWSVARTPKPD